MISSIRVHVYYDDSESPNHWAGFLTSLAHGVPATKSFHLGLYHIKPGTNGAILNLGSIGFKTPAGVEVLLTCNLQSEHIL